MEQDKMDSLGVECLCQSVANSVEDTRSLNTESTKFIHSNQVLIQTEDKTYNIMGMEVK